MSIRRRLSAIGVGALFALAGLHPAHASAAGCWKVCITEAWLNGSNLHLAWNADDPFVKFSISWQSTNYDLDSHYQDVDSDTFAFDVPNLSPGKTYRVTVAGCTETAPWYADGRCVNADSRVIST